MGTVTMRRLAAALVLGGLVCGGPAAHGQSKTKDPKPVTPSDPCRYVGGVSTGGALGQLERLNGIGAGSGHTGVGFDGRERVPVNTGSPSGPRSGSDVNVRTPVNPTCGTGPATPHVVQGGKKK